MGGSWLYNLYVLPNEGYSWKPSFSSVTFNNDRQATRLYELDLTGRPQQVLLFDFILNFSSSQSEFLKVISWWNVAVAMFIWILCAGRVCGLCSFVEVSMFWSEWWLGGAWVCMSLVDTKDGELHAFLFAPTFFSISLFFLTSPSAVGVLFLLVLVSWFGDTTDGNWPFPLNRNWTL